MPDNHKHQRQLIQQVPKWDLTKKKISDIPGFSKAQESPDFLPSAEPGYPLSLQKCQSAPSKNISNEQNSDSEMRRFITSRRMFSIYLQMSN
jgi:hypothetical protein